MPALPRNTTAPCGSDSWTRATHVAPIARLATYGNLTLYSGAMKQEAPTTARLEARLGQPARVRAASPR